MSAAGAAESLADELGVATGMPESAPASAEAAAALAAEAAELKDRLLRTLADMENLRRRSARDADDARKYAVTGFARGLLEVADTLGRALAAVPAEARSRDEFLNNFANGIELTQRTLLALFEKHEIRQVQPERGQRFDHNLHQAMFEVPTAQLPAGTIAEILQPGYVIADRLLRPAMVGVAKGGARPGGEAVSAGEAGVGTAA